MKKIVFNKFCDKFKIGEVTKQVNLKMFLEEDYGELKTSALTWRIYDLINREYIMSNRNNLFIVIDRERHIQETYLFNKD